MTTVQKSVQVIARTQFEDDPRKVVYRVRSSRNASAEYETTLFDGRATSCTCPSRLRCYHAQQLEAREAQYITREQAIAAARKNSEAELARIEQETLAHIAREQAAPRKPLSEMARIATLPDSYRAEATAEKDRVIAEFVLSEAEKAAAVIAASDDSSSGSDSGDPWFGLSSAERFQAWRNYEAAMAGLA